MWGDEYRKLYEKYGFDLFVVMPIPEIRYLINGGSIRKTDIPPNNLGKCFIVISKVRESQLSDVYMQNLHEDKRKKKKDDIEEKELLKYSHRIIGMAQIRYRKGIRYVEKFIEFDEDEKIKLENIEEKYDSILNINRWVRN